MAQTIFFNGLKSIPIDSFPKEAWITLIGDSEGDGKNNVHHLVGTMRRCIDIRSNSVGAVPWVITSNTTGDIVWSSDINLVPPELKFLKDLKKLIVLTEKSLCISSQAFWLLERSMGKKILNVRWVTPKTMSLKWDKEKGLVGFTRILSPNDERPFKIEDVVYIYTPDPESETRPNVSLVDSSKVAAQVLLNIDQFTKMFFERGAIKSTLLTVEGNPSQQERTRLKNWWDRLFTGVGNAWKSEVVSASVKPVTIGEGVGELSDKELVKEKREEIAITFGVPHSLLFSNASNFATAKQDKRNFYDETIVPQLDLIAPSLNDIIFSPLGLSFTFTPDAMDIYQEDENERAKSLGAYVRVGIPLDVSAEILGIKLPEGMQYTDLLIPQSSSSSLENDLKKWQRKSLNRINKGHSSGFCTFDSTFIPYFYKSFVEDGLKIAGNNKSFVKQVFEFQESFNSPSWKFQNNNHQKLFKLWFKQNEEDEKEVNDLKALLSLNSSDDDIEQNNKDLQKIEDDTTKALEKVFATTIPETILEGNSPKSTNEDVDMGKLLNSVDRVEMVHSTLVSDILKESLVNAVNLGVSVAIDQLESVGLNFDWTLTNIDARNWALDYSGQLITGISSTSQKAVKQAIAKWIDNGLPLSSLTKELTPLFGKRRASLIAATEITKAYAEANRIAYRNSKLVSGMKWNTSLDERVCPICGPLHDKTIDLDGSFGESFEIPPAHPKCRCSISPIVDTKLVREKVAS